MLNVIFYENDLKEDAAPQPIDKNIHLETLKYGSSKFITCSNLTSFTSDLSSLKDGNMMFASCSNLASFTSDLSSLKNGNMMFMGCTNLTSFTSDLSSLADGTMMFMGCTNLTSFTSDLSSLTNGTRIFAACSNLTSFTSDLSALEDGNNMFSGCSNLTSFTSDLSSLIEGLNMFSGCSNLTSFSGDLSSLTNGDSMFYYCSNLTSFTSDLSSLTNGNNMFSGCKLDAISVMHIVDSIKNIIKEKQLYINGLTPYVTHDSTTKKYSKPFGFMSNGNYVYTYNNNTMVMNALSVGTLSLGINVTNDSTTINDQLQTFAEEAYFNSWSELKQVFVDKGWTVTFQYGGTSTKITLSEDEKFRGVPVYARLIEVTPEGEEYTEEEKTSAEYCTEDGTKYYNIDWGHDVTDYDQYQYFGSLLEACGYFGVIPKKYLEEA